MDSVTKGVRPSKLDACIENITRTLTQKSQEDEPHEPSNQSNFYKTEPYQATSESDTSLKMKIRKVGPFQTPDELKPYECPVCHKKISNQANLRTHIRTHTGDKPHRCGICGKSFSRNGTLQTHLTIHSGVKLYKCEICGRAIRDRGNLSKHMKIHLTNIATKKEIDETADFRMRLPKKENGSLHNSQRDVHMRDLDSNTSQMDILKKEIYALNNSQIENLKKEIGSAIRDLPIEPPRPKYQAIHAIDYSQSGRSGSLSPDRGGETKTNEALKLNMFSKLEMKRKESSTTQKLGHTPDNKVTYNCGLCSVAFPNTDSYFSHMMAHARDQSYNQRGPEFLDDQLLPWRKMKKQLKQDPDQNVFNSAEQEMLAAYDREIRAYKEHQRRADEKFNRLHMEQPTTSATEDDVMDEEESSMTSVVEEQKVKEKDNYKCGICGGEYKTKDSFEDHITIHKVDKPYQCTLCLEQFKELRDLQKHTRSHRGLKPYYCEKCGKEFNQAILLVEHLQRHSAEDQQPSGSNLNGNFSDSSSKLPHQQQPQGENQEMFIVIE